MKTEDEIEKMIKCAAIGDSITVQCSKCAQLNELTFKTGADLGRRLERERILDFLKNASSRVNAEDIDLGILKASGDFWVTWIEEQLRKETE